MKTSGPPSPSIPSRGIPTLRGPILTDAKITHYIRRGAYGPAMQQRQAEWDEYKKKGKRPKAKDPLADVRKLLNSLL